MPGTGESSNESGSQTTVTVPGVAQHRSVLLTVEQGAYGTSFAWTDQNYQGNYKYPVITVGRDGVTRITATGNVSLNAPALQTIGAPIGYGQSGAGVLSWQSPGDGVTQIVRYRPVGGIAWQQMAATPRDNGLYGVDTAQLGAGSYELS